MSCGTPILIVPPCPYPGEDCPRPHRRTRDFDPHNPPKPRVKPDPRPPLPCINNGCCACKPGRLPKKPMMANLKLRQLADCYGCRVSQECHNRRNTFYQRWQTFLDRTARLPNTDYTVYCCDKYVDLGVNNDFFKYDRNLDLRKSPRQAALENFLFLKNISDVNQEFNRAYSECAPYECWIKWGDPDEDPIATKLDQSLRLRHEPQISRWSQLKLRPEYMNDVPASTIYNSRLQPFHKDVHFSTPIEETTQFPRGGLSPFYELREKKRNM